MPTPSMPVIAWAPTCVTLLPTVVVISTLPVPVARAAEADWQQSRTIAQYQMGSATKQRDAV